MHVSLRDHLILHLWKLEFHENGLNYSVGVWLVISNEGKGVDNALDCPW